MSWSTTAMGITVRAGGEAMIYVQVTQTDRERPAVDGIHRDSAQLRRAGLGVRGVLAAALPLAVGGFAILGRWPVLRGYPW